MNFEDCIVRLRELIVRSFPEFARVLAVTEERQVTVMISWKLRPDRGQSKRRSQTVRLVISGQAIAEYAAVTDSERGRAENQFEHYLWRRWVAFDTSNHRAGGSVLPVVTWPVASILQPRD